jgi:hypothetical protein
MELCRSFTVVKLSPGKHAYAQLNDAGIQAQQGVLESELALLARAYAPANGEQLAKEPLERLPRPMCIRVCESALCRCRAQSQVIELATRYGKTITYLAKTLGLSELAKQHSNALIPTSEPFAVALSRGLTNYTSEPGSWYDLHDLGE